MTVLFRAEAVHGARLSPTSRAERGRKNSHSAAGSLVHARRSCVPVEVVPATLASLANLARWLFVEITVFVLWSLFTVSLD